jgi:chromosome segregation ATPase
MSIIIYILIIIFGFLLINHIFEHCLKSIEGLTGKNINSLAGTIGGMGHSITELKKKLNKTLNQSKQLLEKLKSAGTSKDMNNTANTHSSIQSLSLKPKALDCEGFQNQKTLNKLQADTITHATTLGALDDIISDINANIKNTKKDLPKKK